MTLLPTTLIGHASFCQKNKKVGFCAFQPREPLFYLSVGKLNSSCCSVMKSDDGIYKFALLETFYQLCFNWAFGA